MTRILVTGGRGFIGHHLTQLLVDRQHDVRVLSRSRQPPGDVAVRVVAGPSDDAKIRAAVDDVGVVVHLAGRVHVTRDTASDPVKAFRAANVELTRALLYASVAGGVHRFVYVSSVKAMGETSDGVWCEDSPTVPVDPYGRSKYDAECLVREVGAQSGMETVILRLPLVYGAGMKGNMLRLFQLVDRRVPLPVKSIANRRSFLFVGNLVAAIELLMHHPAAANELFLVSDGPPISTAELVREVAAALGTTARSYSCPPRLFRLAGRIGDTLSRFIPFPLTSDAVARVVGNLEVNSRKLSTLTGFRPPYSMSQGLRATAEWYKTAMRGERA